MQLKVHYDFDDDFVVPVHRGEALLKLCRLLLRDVARHQL
jgi:hypothetical protein